MRTKRTLLNMAYALGSSLLLLLLGLVTRRLLVDNFGPQITTASQVVSQLFNFFSIAEFGVGSVISYRLYEQIAAKNEEKISKYMSMYKWAYRVVGLDIAGLALIGAAAGGFCIILAELAFKHTVLETQLLFFCFPYSPASDPVSSGSGEYGKPAISAGRQQG